QLSGKTHALLSFSLFLPSVSAPSFLSIYLAPPGVGVVLYKPAFGGEPDAFDR
ncbi:hypothetical protein ACLOJK_041559, partial [Asimina triloba]